MPLTNAQFSILPLGYLSGEDLMVFCPAPLLIQRNIVLPSQPQRGATLAYSEITSALINRYDIATELKKLAPLQGTATAALTGDAVSGVAVVLPGGTYATPPVVTITGGGGAGATAVAVISELGVLTGINITAGGIGYTSVPVVTLSGGLAADSRSELLVKIASIITIRNVLGASQNTGDQLDELYRWADKTLLAIRNAQMNLPLGYPPNQTTTGSLGQPVTSNPGDEALLVQSSFSYLG